MRKMKFEDFEKSILSRKQLYNTKGGDGSNPQEIDVYGNVINNGPAPLDPPGGPGSLLNNGSGSIKPILP